MRPRLQSRSLQRTRPSTPFAAHIQHLPLQFPHPQSRDPTNDSAKRCPSLGNPFMLSTHRAQTSSVIPPRSSVVSCAICGSARASASTPTSPILFPASRAHRITPLHTVRRPQYNICPYSSHSRLIERERTTPQSHAQASAAHSCYQAAERRRGRTAEIERCQLRHLRQRPRQHLHARVSDPDLCKPRSSLTPLHTVRRPHTTSALTVPTPAEQRAKPCPSLGSPFMLSSRRAQARSCR